TGRREPVTVIFSIFSCACAAGLARPTMTPALTACATASDSFFLCILFIMDPHGVEKLQLPCHYRRIPFVRSDTERNVEQIGKMKRIGTITPCRSACLAVAALRSPLRSQTSHFELRKKVTR